MKRVGKIEFTNWLQQVGKGMVELVFTSPSYCPVCGQEESLANGLGKNCLRKIALIQAPVCRKCGRPKRLLATVGDICNQCNETRYFFSEARAVAVYDGALREYLTELKYRYRPDLGEALGMLIVDWIKYHREFYRKINLIIPIPIHWQKLSVRGYNQAELLANPLQKYLGIKIKNDIIIRDKITESQNALSKEERFANIDRAFRVNDTVSVSGARVLLVDDIFTTGATVSEAARVLLRAGALDVKVLTLAGGVMDSEWTMQ